MKRLNLIVSLLMLVTVSAHGTKSVEFNDGAHGNDLHKEYYLGGPSKCYHEKYRVLYVLEKLSPGFLERAIEYHDRTYPTVLRSARVNRFWLQENSALLGSIYNEAFGPSFVVKPDTFSRARGACGMVWYDHPTVTCVAWNISQQMPGYDDIRSCGPGY
jgi:hypothetical protein